MERRESMDNFGATEDMMQNNPLYFDKNAYIMKMALVVVVGGMACYAFKTALANCETFSCNVETRVGRGSFEFKTRK
jgi:hypothetical protein